MEPDELQLGEKLSAGQRVPVGRRIPLRAEYFLNLKFEFKLLNPLDSYGVTLRSSVLTTSKYEAENSIFSPSGYCSYRLFPRCFCKVSTISC